MTKAHDWNQDELERLKTLRSKDARTFTNEDTTIHDRMTSITECREWRNTLRGTQQSARSLTSEYSRQTVERHVKGECYHNEVDVGVGLVRTPGGEWVARGSE